ncbi:sugar-binding transcriptional regulator (plasmid) [Sinorhizobium meliloti WSM1022]|jgi:DNA-binding transcriptional regulator LsrR (DeoR family)|uniref:sugar-binding transcriptional regulator n=1 Tax=Rhizobium meliloti TaxID=382 RepID=UPI00028616D6|nr:sugar-binding transcriptional regulator [Sinorhizobium meliloti]AGA11219.1 Transcriptional regulator, contains sigma factor-related N-terminal domain [Sinorhizobium meliloti GR4]ARS68895.1 Crp/Fnr family transcriptional regulator [Sinorhizobium meliloti RU11/001]ASP76145.1 Crp/Fnr family transcriptional regulator [Sinorhizobium meliloti]ASP81702.1 Crp/Fnr family transcriptional regulator [Sinorhizobium meliloti]MCO6420153.1 sugar-binding transcriptional regulator [Sinorhizobium meliloti]
MPNAKPKSMSAPREEIVIARQMHQALVLHFLEGMTQAQIADQLGISHATVNRLIKRGRQLGLVEIKIKSPVEPLVEIEEQLLALGGIRRAVVVPTVSDNPQIALQSVGEAAARLMLEQIADGDTICITGGKGVSAVVAGLQPSRRFDIEVIPATGCVQGKHYTDVNHVSTLMADRLGGHSFQIHAPLFADSEAERKMLLGMRSVADVFKRARDAKIAVVGIGSILSDDSSYYDLHPSSSTDREAIEQSGASCELLAHLLDDHGRVCGYGLNRRLVSLTLSEFASIPTKIGVASGPSKAGPILSVMRGNHLDTLVTDQATGARILELAKEGGERS